MDSNNQPVRLSGHCPSACLVLACLALVVAPVPVQGGDGPPPLVKGNFLSGGQPIRVEQFEPDGKGKCPAVVFLYGVDGLHAGNETAFRAAARQVANKGFVVLLVHYLDRTKTVPKDAPLLRQRFRGFLDNPVAAGKEQQDMRRMYGAWEDTVRDAVAHARKHPKVDKDRIGLVGYSLGGFLAASVAAEPRQKIAAVVTLFGGIPRDRGRALKQFPAVLILSGDKDEVVPVQESQHLWDLLKDRKLPCECKIYEGIGHGFTRNGKLDPLCALEAQARVSQFLTKVLLSGGAAQKARRS